MAYIKLATLEYPLHEGNIRLEHPEILESQTGDTFPCPPTYAKVEQTEPPIDYPTPSQALNFNAEHFKPEETAPLFDGLKWVTGWTFVPKTVEDYRQEMIDEDSEENNSLKEKIQFAWVQSMGQPDPRVKASYQEYHDALKTYFETYPRSGTWPQRKITLSDGNRVTVDSNGSTPDVIG